MYKMTPWSYSSISTFRTCPRKYFHEKVIKDLPPEPETPILAYGKAIHKALEDAVNGIPLPDSMAFLEAYLAPLMAIEGEKLAELKVGIVRDSNGFRACDFFASDVWFRGVADLVILNQAKGVAYIIDYKAGRSAKYADPLQLRLMAASVFLKYPDIQRVKAMLLFITAKAIVQESYPRSEMLKVFIDLDELLHRRTVAYCTGIFNPTPNGLCRSYCGVTTCENYGH